MYAPTVNAKALAEAIDNVVTTGIQMDIKENGKEYVILRELRNYECFYSWDLHDCICALSDYPITEEEIETAFHKHVKSEGQ